MYRSNRNRNIADGGILSPNFSCWFFFSSPFIIIVFLCVPEHSAQGQSLLSKDTLKTSPKYTNVLKEKTLDFKKNNLLNDSLLKVKPDSSYSFKKPKFPAKGSTFRKADSTQVNSLSDSAKSHLSLKKVKNKIPKPKPNTSGSISAGYDYGIIPFAANINYPMGYYKAEGNASVEVFSLPLNVSFYYSDLQNVSGLNNYYRVSFDSKKYKENLTKKMYGQQKEATARLEKLYAQRQETTQKLEFLKSPQSLTQLDGYQNKLKQPQLNSNFSPDVPGLDTSKLKINQPSVKMPDSNGFADSLKIAGEKMYQDSLKNYSAYLQKADSVNNKIKEYQNALKEYEEEIKKAKELVNAYKNPEQAAGKYNPYGNKVNEWMAAIKTFDIGLCYPNYSTFLINGATVKGVNLELEKSGYYLAFTHGKTINNLLYTNNQVQNTLQNAKNLYNFFDFNDVSDSRRITAIKFGIGKKEESHLHFGLLYGYGQTSYMQSNPAYLPDREKNYVGEVDAKWVIDANNTIDIVYGKSSMQQEYQPIGSNEKGFSALVNKQERSNAALARYTSSIAKTRTRLTFTGRWIDPFFKSYGLGFMRSDNFRYEVKAEQPINSRIKVTGLYRKDEDNLLKLYFYKTTLQTIGTNISVKLTKRLMVRVGYNPVLQKVRSSDNSIHITNKNNISNVVVTYVPKIKHIHTSFNALYSYYNLSNDSIKNTFQNINFSNVTQFKVPLKNSFSASWFLSNAIDSLNNNTILLTDDISYTFKNELSVSVGGKYAISDAIKDQIGYTVKASVPLVKRLSTELSFEKLVLGDFYNSYNMEQIKKFPYYSYAKLIYTW